MKDFAKRYPELYQFLAGYFHPDWKNEYDWQGKTPNFEHAVLLYKNGNPPATVAQATDELQQFLALPLDEKEFNDIATHKLGAVYTPRSRGLTKRQWLEQVLVILQEPTTNSNLRFVLN